MHGVTETIVIVTIGGFVGALVAAAVWEVIRLCFWGR